MGPGAGCYRNDLWTWPGLGRRPERSWPPGAEFSTPVNLRVARPGGLHRPCFYHHRRPGSCNVFVTYVRAASLLPAAFCFLSTTSRFRGERAQTADGKFGQSLERPRTCGGSAKWNRRVPSCSRLQTSDAPASKYRATFSQTSGGVFDGERTSTRPKVVLHRVCTGPKMS